MAKLKETGAVASDEKGDAFSWIEVVRCFQSVHVWLLSPVIFSIGKCALLGLSIFK